MEGSAHYDGRAIDIFVRPVNKANKQNGWSMAQYLVAKAERLKIQKVIFDDRIWTAGSRPDKGWRDYDPPTSPATWRSWNTATTSTSMSSTERGAYHAPMNHTWGKLAGVLIVAAGGLVALSPPASAADPCADPTIVGTAGDDRLVGTDGPDVIDGGDGDDNLTGGGGDDILCGGPGEDQAGRQGAGDDALVRRPRRALLPLRHRRSSYGDLLAGGPGDDTLDPGLDPRSDLPNDLISFESSTSGVVVDVNAGTATGDGTDTIVDAVYYVIGSRHDDDVTGGDAREILIGSGGADTIDGGAGDDEVYAGPQGFGTNDDLRNVLHGGSGDDSVVGGHGHDILYGGPDDDFLSDSEGRDRLYGEAGDDHVQDGCLQGHGTGARRRRGPRRAGRPLPLQGVPPAVGEPHPGRPEGGAVGHPRRQPRDHGADHRVRGCRGAVGRARDDPRQPTVPTRSTRARTARSGCAPGAGTTC